MTTWPSKVEWAGRRTRAMPAPAMRASLAAPALSSLASVATTIKLVFSVTGGVGGRGSRARAFAVSRNSPVSGSRVPAKIFPVSQSSTVAQVIDHGQGADADALRGSDRGRADSGLRCVFDAQEFAHRGPGPRAHRAHFHGGRAGGLAGPIAETLIRPDLRALEGEVEDDGRGHDGHHRHPREIADAALGQILHDPVGGGQTEGRSAGEADRVSASGDVEGIEGEQFARAGGQAAHVHSAHRALLEDDHGGPGAGRPVRAMPDLDPGHQGKGSDLFMPFQHFHRYENYGQNEQEKQEARRKKQQKPIR